MIKFMNEESSIPMVQQPHNQTTYIHTHVGEVAKGSLGLLEGANIFSQIFSFESQLRSTP